MRKRPAARILLLDPFDRVLLFRYRHDDGPLAGRVYWATPGGSLGTGEDFAQAARRELLEETGIAAAEIGQCVAVRHVEFMMPDGGMVDAEERYFLVRTTEAIELGNNPDPVESAFISAARWWALDEIGASAETIYPENIAEMIATALDATRSG